LKESILPE